LSLSRLPKVIIAEDVRLFAEALAESFRRSGRLEVVGTFSERTEIIEAAKTQSADLVLLDIFLKNSNGFEIARELATQAPSARILGFSGLVEPVIVRQFIQSGGSGFISKGCSTSELIQGIEACLAGQMVLPESMARHFAELENRGTMLSPRESEVLGMIGDGLTSAAIAEKLNLSVKTVETHRQRTMAKLELGSTAELVKAAVKLGLTKL
jgi:DNA-binding NarL/FixJ family response regulator